MTSDTWGNAAGPDEDAEEGPDPLLRPAWESEPDETDAARPGVRRPMPAIPPVIGRTGSDPRPMGEDLPALLTPLCDATEALARLDARLTAAPEPVREGLTARMAFTEAAGWLAHAHAWAHPLDLALRDLDLTGSPALIATGGGHRVLPHTFAGAGGRMDWDDQTFEDMAAGDRAVADALALARLLRRLAHARAHDPFGSVAEAESTLAPFGAGPLDPTRFAQWRAEFSVRSPARRRPSNRGRKGVAPALPQMLLAARAAEAWMESGIADLPTPLQAMLTAACLLAHTGPARSVFVPVWAAYPAIGHGERDTLPRLRSDVAARVGRWGGGGQGSAGVSRWNSAGGRGGGWTLTFLHLVAEGARAGLRELDRMTSVAGQAHALTARGDRRSRLPEAVDAALRAPALTPKALAARLRIAPQTATALLRELRAAGLVREVTGRKSFRAFAV